MSYYAGFSLREVYKKRCADLQCAANSAVLEELSDVPDDFASLTSLDLSRNFLGTKGVIPLLDVVECAKAIRSLNLRNQELGNEAAAIICARLRRHPALQKLDMSHNPITLAVSTDLLELAKNNPVLQYISLEHTLVRPSMVTVIEVQLEKNRQRALRPTSPARTAAIKMVSSSPASPTTSASAGASAAVAGSQEPSRAPTPGADAPSAAKATDASLTPAGGGASAAVALSQKASHSPRAKVVPRKRCPPHEVQHVLRTYTHSITDVLFDVDPTSDLWSWCEDHHYFFDDDQFSSHNDDLHRTSRHTYGIAGWRRVGELYPKASLFGVDAVADLCNVSDDRGATNDNHATAVSAAVASGLLSEVNSLFLQLPKDIPDGFTWTFTSLVASVRDIKSLQALLCCPCTGTTAAAAATTNTSSSSPSGPPLALQQGTEFPGIYAMRLHVEGVWRYLIVDDFLPVDKFGHLIFTKPALNENAFWPCILEKMLAKLHGGYYALDSNFGEHRVGIDGPSIRRPIEWRYLSRENLGSPASGCPAEVSPASTAIEPSSVPFEQLAGSCGRVMSQLTSGFYESYCLHPQEESVKGKWWDVMLRTLAVPRNSYGNGFQRHTSAVPPGTAPRADGEGRLRQASSVRQHSTFGGAGRASLAASSSGNAASAFSPAVHTGVVAFSRDAAHTSNGIHSRTAYQVLGACHMNGVRLLMLRNPWCGGQKWSGDWADDSPLWKKNPEVADMLLQRTSTLVGGGESLRGLSEVTAYAHGDSSVLTMQSSLKRSLLTAMCGRSGGGSGGEVGARNTLSFASHSGTSALGVTGSGSLAHVVKSSFWMSYTDFLQQFDWVHFCSVFGDEFYRRDIHHEWTCKTAGGNLQEPSWHNNPHYRLKLAHRTTVRLQLNRRDVGLHSSRAAASAGAPQCGEGGIGLQLIRDASYPLHCPPTLNPRENHSTSAVDSGEAEGGVLSGSAGNGQQGGANAALSAFPSSSSTAFSTLLFSAVAPVGCHLTAEITLDAGTQYWIIPTTHAPRVLDHFDLTVVAPAGFQVQEATEAQYWDSRTAPPELLMASSAPQACQNDGELAILLKAHTRVFMDAVTVLMQAKNKKRMAQLAPNNPQTTGLASNRTANFSSQELQQSLQPCRIVVTATMEVVDNEDEMDDFGVDEAYERQMHQDNLFEQNPAVSLVIAPGEVDTAGNPSRTIGEVDPLPSHIYAIGQSAVLETEVSPAAEHEVAYYTAICSPHPAGTRALISYQVWCAAPLLEVRSMPKWAKQEIVVGWGDERGSGNFYDCDGHPQIELTELQPHQRFTVALRMIDYDTIVPAIMFSVIRSAYQAGEAISGRLVDNELYARSEYVDATEVQGNFALDGDVPTSLLLIPCLQPTGTCGRCLVTILSDSAGFRARALCGGTQQ
ncbi:putative calpain-like cysteine peptidase putative cysteine peptidase Clan CA family C2 [Leptomonas seymouri]|uniref:Putative calpain-like cysteine peptidase putative cysteine peptidase Clan CA family C2 n=1 Tax=Leptomonas seymouri TaxID=5684 RepID=A0A0N1I8D6_LEPSE|nr:putative calpain-like cysteine peptidase putative cysteine peptidase Clan CA family C2 [Leptomonas seymouri]|eukprot:KPI90163.1 putative calpain-like cysteine peptidase putative cysteine peptidase Clan CA family C2 [Leptomonas seymouri]